MLQFFIWHVEYNYDFYPHRWHILCLTLKDEDITRLSTLWLSDITGLWIFTPGLLLRVTSLWNQTYIRSV